MFDAEDNPPDSGQHPEGLEGIVRCRQTDDAKQDQEPAGQGVQAEQGRPDLLVLDQLPDRGKEIAQNELGPP